MFPQWGFVDTMATFGPNAYAGTSGAMANQFAAMPSLHIGWAALIAYVIHRTGPRWLAWVATAHLVVTVLVVVVTANHYWLDGVVALVLLAGVALVIRRPGPDRIAPAEEGHCATSAPWRPLTGWSPELSTARRSSSSPRA